MALAAASTFIAADLTTWLTDHAVQAVGLLIVVVGLGILGLGDVLRFSMKRVWAISGVCFDESIRRRVLWIIPLAIVGLVIIVQLQQPNDEQDAIRQTTKFCLFATGMVVVISTVILACTNLPREIENRVIFTVVTKPTTRLEIILGKIVGFARVSATILLIMGLFTFSYLHFRAWNLERDLSDRLRLNAVESISRPTFQHYVDAGLLNAKTLSVPSSLSVFGRTPVAGNPRRYIASEGRVLIPFQLPADSWAVADPEGKQHAGPGFTIKLRVGYDVAAPVPPLLAAPPSLLAPSLTATPHKLDVNLFDAESHSAVGGNSMIGSMVVPSADGSQIMSLDVPASDVPLLTKFPYFYVAIGATVGDAKFWVKDDPAAPPAELSVPVTSKAEPQRVEPLPSSDPSQPVALVFTNRDGLTGQQVKGDASGTSEVCVYHFRHVNVEAGNRPQIPVELRVVVEKSGEATDSDIPTHAVKSVVNIKSGQVSGDVAIMPENARPFYSSIPTSAVEGGNFDVRLKLLTAGQWLNVGPRSISVVQAENSFAMNLFKSMVILWLLSILVTSISVFCSTFLSWPIAVVLTLVILLGRWGVNELGDAATAGLGRQFVQDFAIRDVPVATAVSATVEQLNKMLKLVSTALPDIEQFAVTEDIERGISIPISTLKESCLVLLYFGVPLTVLAYIFLKNKEVAP